MKQQVRKEIKARIKSSVPKNELRALIYNYSNSSEFKWHHKKEFCYHGTMYDIVSSERLLNGDIIFYCVTDSQETILFKNLGKHVNDLVNTNPKNTGATVLLSMFMGSLYPPIVNDYEPLFIEKEIISGFTLQVYNDRDPSVNIPPPKG